MEFVKDAIFNIRFNKKNYRKGKKLSEFITSNKFIVTLLILGLAVCSINCVLIYNFIQVLSTL